MLPELKLKFNDHNFLGWRLTPRRLSPPSAKPKEPSPSSHKPLTAADLNPKPPPPPIIIPGTEAIIVDRLIFNYPSSGKREKIIGIALAPAIPFSDSCLQFSRRNKANWNDTFNLWQIPVREVRHNLLFAGIWGLVLEALYEVDWSNFAPVELHWNIGGNEKLFSVLDRKIDNYNQIRRPVTSDQPIASITSNLRRVVMLGYTPPEYSEWLEPHNQRANYLQYRSAMLSRDGYACVYCGTHDHLTLDHLIPLERRGWNQLDNLAIACFQCNQRKGNSLPEEVGISFYNSDAQKLYAAAKDKWQARNEQIYQQILQQLQQKDE